jgi:uncharacterized protein YciI
MSNSSAATPSNPSGALPGDPRHGLSEEQLVAYYSGLGPSWIVHAVVRDGGGLEIVGSVMDEHLEYLRSSSDQIRFAGPSLGADGITKVGSIWLIDAADRAAAEKWVAAEPFSDAGAFSSVTLTRWSSSMQIRQHDYARTEGWKQFAITAHDRPDGSERRNAVAEAHHEFQATVMDRYVARGPMLTDDGSEMTGSFMIMEFPDRRACDEFWAAEPLNTGGVFAEVRIDPWRYGAALR